MRQTLKSTYYFASIAADDKKKSTYYFYMLIKFKNSASRVFFFRNSRRVKEKNLPFCEKQNQLLKTDLDLIISLTVIFSSLGICLKNNGLFFSCSTICFLTYNALSVKKHQFLLFVKRTIMGVYTLFLRKHTILVFVRRIIMGIYALFVRKLKFLMLCLTNNNWSLNIICKETQMLDVLPEK